MRNKISYKHTDKSESQGASLAFYILLVLFVILGTYTVLNSNSAKRQINENQGSGNTVSDQQSQPNCDSNYSGCVPMSGTDLDCSDIQETVQVYGTDRHNLDGDSDGYGCETYGR
jgi:hypothetical protein